MAKLYRGQSALRISARTFMQLEGIATTSIKFRKPDGSTGSFASAVIDTEQGIIAHEILDGELDQAGWWFFWAFIVFLDGRSAAGEASRVFIWEEGAGA